MHFQRQGESKQYSWSRVYVGQALSVFLIHLTQHFDIILTHVDFLTAHVWSRQGQESICICSLIRKTKALLETPTGFPCRFTGQNHVTWLPLAAGEAGKFLFSLSAEGRQGRMGLRIDVSELTTQWLPSGCRESLSNPFMYRWQNWVPGMGSSLTKVPHLDEITARSRAQTTSTPCPESDPLNYIMNVVWQSLWLKVCWRKRILSRKRGDEYETISSGQRT